MPDVGTLVDTGFIVLLFHAVLAPATAIHATLYKRDSRAAFGWIALCILLPVAGPILYQPPPFVHTKLLAGVLESHVRSAIDGGREVTLAEVDGRSLPARLRDSICWLFSPYL